MEYRLLGHSGVKVSVLSLGTMTFGGKGNFAKTGSTDMSGARRQIDLCLDAGINLFDTADIVFRGFIRGNSRSGFGRPARWRVDRNQSPLRDGKRSEQCRIFALALDRGG